MRSFSLHISLICAGLLLLAGCDDAGQGSGGPGGMMGGMPPAEVTVMQVGAQDVPLAPEYSARTQGSREVEVRARVGGILLERVYEEGKFIEKGAVMFRIDPDQYKVIYDRALAQLGQAKAVLKAAERNWARVEPLFNEQAVSARTRDEALSTLENAKAGVALANAEVRAAKLNLDYTSVEAPISGIASKETVSEGSLVGTGAADGLLTRMTQLDPIYVNFSYPDADFMMIRRLKDQQEAVVTAEDEAEAGDDVPLQATLTYDNGQAYDLSGTVSFTGATIDPQTGTVQARAVFPNPDGKLMPGQFVRVTLNGLVLPDAIAVPQAAVMQGPEGKFVYKLGADNTAQIAPIKTGIARGNEWIVEQGLAEGDTVIVDGIIKVRPNAPVVVKQPDAAHMGAPPSDSPDMAPAPDAVE